MKKFISKLSNYLMIFVMLFANPATAIFVNALGEEETRAVLKERVVVGDLDGEGHIRVIKTATPVEGKPGTYKIRFEVQGVPYQNTYPLYAAVVFDRSGSMICNSHSIAHEVSSDAQYTAGDGQGISCGVDSSSWFGTDTTWYPNDLTQTKWENAVSGAQSFNSTVKEALGDNAHVSLITFAANVASATTDFTDSSFGHPVGGTYLSGAIDAAKEKIESDIQTDNATNAKKVILVISDGSPTLPSSYWDSNYAKTEATNSATNAKNAGIEIYAIGYATDSTTSAYLRDNISSYDSSNANDAHYSDADPDTVSAAVQGIVKEVLAAGLNPTLEDTITSEFTFNSSAFTGDSHTFTLNNITSEPQFVEFEVDINQDLPSGIYDTNSTEDGSCATLTYKTPDGEEHSIVLDESPSVEWVQPAYTVNYYKDSIDGELFDTETGAGAPGKSIPYSTTKEVKGYVYSTTSGQSTITWISENNVLNVIYTKRTDLTYKVYYHYQNLNSDTYSVVEDSTTYNATFGEVISGDKLNNHITAGNQEGFNYNQHQQSPTSIDDVLDNRLDIYYTRESYDYCVNYYYDGEQDNDETVTGSAQYGDMLTYQDKNRPGYVLSYTDPESGSLTIGTGDNTISVFYVKGMFNYTINYYKDDGVSTTKIGDTVTESAEFDSDIVVSNERLLARIPTGYRLQDNQGNTIHITEIAENNNLDVIYVKDGFNYTINYYKDDGTTTTKIGDTVTRSAEFDSIITLSNDDLNARLPEGYKLQDNQEDTIHITEVEANNNLDIIYVKNSYAYTVNYYRDSINSSNKLGDTVTGSALFDTDVTLTEDELNARIPEGYKLQDNQEDTIHITVNASNNNLDILYVKDSFGYTVNYYMDDGSSTSKIGDTVTGTALFDTDVTLTDQELNARVPDGYVLQDNQENTIHITTNTDNNNLDIIYVKGEYDYCVNYYYDGEQDEDETVTGSALFGEMISYENKDRPGYVLSYTDPESGEIEISSNSDNNVINVYYVRGEFNYTVEYYYDGELDSSKTEEITALYGDEITEYAEKLIDGFEFDKVENLPLTISDNEEENVIKVYYKSYPIEVPIPNTGIDSSKNYLELLIILMSTLISILYVSKKENE